MADYETILAEERDGVLSLTLNRPAVKNAMSIGMARELRAALAAAEAGGTVRAIVLRGAGGTFCAGGDISDMAKARSEPKAGGRDPFAAVNREFGEMCVAYASTGIAVVAAVEGVALGGGFGLACVSDVTIVARAARFGLPETSLGVVPAQILPLLIERIGYGQTKRLAVVGGFVEADEALSLGLAHEVTDDIDRAVEACVGKILRCAPGALAATKALLREARLAPTGAMIGRAAEVFSAALTSAEGAEGTAAFLEKRRPAWAAKP
ncbi:MAG: enoyl-CoA hydratase-related protein [Pseudomonadota bacterium]